VKQSKPFIGRSSVKLSRDLLVLDRKQCRLVRGLLTWYYALRQHLHIMGFLKNTKCRKCGQDEESSYHTLCPVLARHRLGVFNSVWLELIDIRKTSVRCVLAVAVWLGLFKGP
jgi:hypothetical protein